ncbi:uncharacterized protein MEPE_02815 [Melanopsichium pennsylvanicum]|uniref:GATA-type domain-containing protein n=2 Tax=Melanopsichium pennsylvanicum TaxID=63383 RepID=A0AAJ5C4W5_9BASI|nr:hypothetical protein BN887_03513 [Melanopsichium pennsylvanicum 4]SNX84107.1 uncharacterized protein MEPE_02815 [Melanopsichium pennsylvanicum]
MSIGSERSSSDSIQVHPGPAAAGSTPAAIPISKPDFVPRTPTPPPSSAQPQQQQIQQHQPPNLTLSRKQSTQIAATPPTEHGVAPVAAKVAPSAIAAISQPPQRPPPPASAVSLHDAAAKAAAAATHTCGANRSAPKPVAAIAPKPTVHQPPQARVSSLAPHDGKTDANGTAKKAGRAKSTKPPGTAKPKQKRKANHAGAQDDHVYRPGSSTAGGTIGVAPDSTIPAMLTAAGGGRKALPELVLPFQLPFAEVRPEFLMLDNASVQAAMAMGASETSSLDTGSDSDDYSVLSDDSELDSEAEESRRQARRRRREPATIEESLVLLQSLRQSRLSHLSSLLTPFSQRVRSGMIYPNVLPLSLLHGLNPRDPHVLIQLGRADIHVGPHVFMKTRFWEVRPDYEMPPDTSSVGGIRAPASFGGSAAYAQMPGPQPTPQQLPQTQPPHLPSPCAPPTMPQPSIPLARPPSTTQKSPAVRPAPAAAQASINGTATTPAASSQTTAKPATIVSPPTLPTPTLPATPFATTAAIRPSAPAKAAVYLAPAGPTLPAPSSTTTSATIAAPTAKLATASSASPATATATPSTAVAASGSIVSKAAATAATVAPASGPSIPVSTTSDSKPTISAPTTLGPKAVAVPVSLPRPPMTTPSLPKPPSINQNNIPSSANSAATSSAGTVAGAGAAAGQKARAEVTKSAGTIPADSTTSSVGPSTASSATSTPAAAAGSAPQTVAATPATGQSMTTTRPAVGAALPTNAPGAAAPVRPAAPPPPPAIDAVLVSRVNATAALNPELQELLHIAASGKANPNQLKALGVWIQAITAQLRQDEARNAASASNAARAAGPRAGATASTTADGKKTKKTKVDEAAKASKKQAKIEEREAKKKAKAEAKAKAQADKQMAQKQQKDKQQMFQQQQQMHNHQQPPSPASNKLRHPPPGWPTDGPPKPPVIVVEFRENPSMRFILPLWKCLVERTEGIERPSILKVKKERRSFFDNDSDDEESQKVEPELKLSFFAPSLGSDAADGSGLRELEEELKRKAAEEAKLNAAKATSPTTQSNEAIANVASSSTASPEAASVSSEKVDDIAAATGKKKKEGATSGSKKGSKAIKQESANLTLSPDSSPSKKHEVYPLTWSIKGGVTESLWEAFGRVPGTMTCQPVKREPEIELEPDVAEFLVPEIRYHLLDLPMEEIKIQKETTDTFVDLYSHMSDRRFILPRVAPALVPQGLEDHMQDRFAVRPQCIQGRPVVKRKAGAREDEVSFSYEGIGLAVIGPNGVKTEPGTTPAKPPKRKRHVATHNPDGSIKSCGACGKTKTPMWRRGPKGPSQLCNACGARWKAGRLVVPEVAPPPIIEAEEDKTKDEEAKKEDEAKASMHGSNALVIPQSSGDDGSFTVMASSGLVGAVPFGDHHHGELFSLSDGKAGSDFSMTRGSTSPSPFIRSPIPEDDVMPASVDPSMLYGSVRVSAHRR